MHPVDARTELGMRLRAHRQRQGISLRELTRQVGLSAHSNLADYEAGRRLPPADVLAACERALDITDAELTALRRAALTERSSCVPVTPPPMRRSHRRRYILLAVTALLMVAGSAMGWQAAKPSAAAPEAVGVSSCDRGAVAVAAAGLRAPGGAALKVPGSARPRLGTVVLWFSRSCGEEWAQFVPTLAGAAEQARLLLSVHRPVDGAVTELQLPQVVTGYSDPLLTVPGCVFGEAQLISARGATVTARTSCA